MQSLMDLIEEIEKCPQLHIGIKNIHLLRAFLCGYCSACVQIEPEFEKDWLWDDFRLWLAERYSDTRSFDWAHLIACNEPDGQSTDAFFRLLKEYLSSL